MALYVENSGSFYDLAVQRNLNAHNINVSGTLSGNLTMFDLVLTGSGTPGTTTTLTSDQTVDQVLFLPNITDRLVSDNSVSTLLNKTITDATNDVTASSLFSDNGLNTVSVVAAANPTVGQVLTATSATAATWQSPSVPSGAASGLLSDAGANTVSVEASANPTAGQVLTASSSTPSRILSGFQPTVYSGT